MGWYSNIRTTRMTRPSSWILSQRGPSTRRVLAFSNVQSTGMVKHNPSNTPSFLTLSDDDRSLPFNNKGLGEIHLVLRKAEVTRKTSPADISTDLHRDTKRHESSKQTGHCIMLGTEISDESTPCFHVNEFKGAVATFIFRYRPLDFLRLNGIAPKQQRTSTPPEDERKRALAVKIEAKEAELRCLKEQQARFRSPSHIKAEITASSSQSASGSSCKFTAWIEVNGKHLPEFGSTVSDDLQTVSCWVPSEAGKEFAVCWKDSTSLYALEGWVSVDGMSCGGICEPTWTLNKEMTYRKDYISTSGTSGRALMFSNVELTDDDSYLQHNQLENLGEIKISLYEVQVLGMTPGAAHASSTADSLAENAKVHERSKKGLGHRVGLGKVVAKIPTSVINRNRIRSVATFIFRYRPLAILQANEIAPIEQSNKRKASTPPQDSDEDVLVVTAPEQIKASETKRVKRVPGHQKKRVKTEVKTESSSASRPTIVKHLGTIDLTDL
ncbi:hypothetical protein BDN72DRAFT_959377 [Pluteus cervinus]|uniref:Uncharacterized protein n=1 Tax=Pluteus cervinus TaxID=181527 RepID=A0ACD3AXF9_9AGAR|nr:hypothetical protein BDN72DRAFT_959377 [Pluteus cervinus]